MTTAHSKIGASSMDRWSQCPGSVRLSEGIVSISSAYAEEGTLAHSLAADWLVNGTKPNFVDNDMHDAVKVYVDYIQPKQVHAKAFIEHKFNLSKVHEGCFGTADCVLWYEQAKHLEVIDYKHGQGVFVPVQDNPQLKYYGLGALLDLGLPAETIQLTVVQPRYDCQDGPIRSVQMGVLDMLDFMADLKRYAMATENPNAPLVPGEHCRWCPAAKTCPELQQQATDVAKLEFRDPMLGTYDGPALKKALDTREIVKAWLKTVDEFAYDVLEKGGEIPGYKLVEKRPTRQWRDEAAAINMLKAAGHPDDAIYEPKALKSPAQIEKSLGKQGAKVVAEFIESKSSGHTVVEASDTRPAVKLNAKVEFAVPVDTTVFD